MSDNDEANNSEEERMYAGGFNDFDDDSDDDVQPAAPQAGKKVDQRQEEEEENSDSEDDEDDGDDLTVSLKPKKEKKLVAAEETQSGVVYLSRLPGFIKGYNWFKNNWSGPFGAVKSVHMTQVPMQKQKNRKYYKEAWVEFEKRSVARKVADFLNNAPVGRQFTKDKREQDFIWNVKYLKGFKMADVVGGDKQRLQQNRLKRRLEQEKKKGSNYMKRVDQANQTKKQKTETDE
ncbi:RNA-binding region RNP-1 domain-containing protein [Planoprotostelium fungivorum]|uniref:RNA-binding region RNP-1 domain-containing protein n=1 Tax=Planoprotostelium fungivorum TaxID=1890364 RepID=A0A2P6NHM6_9EUKA|nr:RNA-binding region RNP-1 domain-containing protein [Planoprotostelium fungivorum]